MTSLTVERPWFVFAELSSGEKLVPGETEGCPGPDVWGECAALRSGLEPACRGAVWYYGPEPRWRITNVTLSAVCPLALFDPIKVRE
jgi:hypothetical protein